MNHNATNALIVAMPTLSQQDDTNKVAPEPSDRALALLRAAALGEIAQVREILAEPGAVALVDERCGFGMSALHYAFRAAAATNNSDTVDLCLMLLRSGANVNATDGANFTPLMTNAIWSRTESDALTVAQILVEHGADVQIAMCEGLLPTDYAMMYGMPKLAAWLREPTVVSQHRRMVSQIRAAATALAKVRIVCDAPERGVFSALTRWLDVELVKAVAGSTVSERQAFAIVRAIQSRHFFRSLEELAGTILGDNYRSLARNNLSFETK